MEIFVYGYTEYDTFADVTVGVATTLFAAMAQIEATDDASEREMWVIGYAADSLERDSRTCVWIKMKKSDGYNWECHR
jgi:hypothetical protein